ncbi:MAG: hypothetical protein MUP92_00050, partial [Actinobacteria bacterium]|nr:hypothetical protein [Actinomycetota bacterium]
ALQAAFDAGARSLAVAGDDATFDEAVTAIVARPDHAELRLTIIPLRDSDFARTFGLPQDPSKACDHVRSDSVYETDVARVTGPAGERYLARVGGVGFGARMSARELSLPAMLGRGRRFAAFWLALAGSRPAPIRVFVGERNRFEGEAWDVIIGNCQFFGGLRVSPRSFPGDGSIEVLVRTGQRAEAFRKMPLMYSGEHVPSDEIFEFRGKQIRIESDREVPVHIDGVPWGTTPVSFEVIPQAFLLSV